MANSRLFHDAVCFMIQYSHVEARTTENCSYIHGHCDRYCFKRPALSSYLTLQMVFFSALQGGIKRRHLETLEKAIEQGKESRFVEKLATPIKDAEDVRDHLLKLNRFAHDILEMKQSTISELRSYKKPPEVVEDVMMATFILLGEKRINVQVQYFLFAVLLRSHNFIYEPRHEKTGFLHMRKQRCRSASR